MPPREAEYSGFITRPKATSGTTLALWQGSMSKTESGEKWSDWNPNCTVTCTGDYRDHHHITLSLASALQPILSPPS
ncbi:hypothetical protein ACN38_g12170 [Penicillium nordicum]|uniref:Uncharacterized protein n=1 Tax=Penicillium nordicum TaxID=229535 RepID=A0A0M9WAA1_9EURO|nr:hypothetical protein ACN38_g12170 [Penicillium nordicum]